MEIPARSPQPAAVACIPVPWVFGKAPRIKRLSEYIGESYFDYLANLDDLVLLMDESHQACREEGEHS